MPVCRFTKDCALLDFVQLCRLRPTRLCPTRKRPNENISACLCASAGPARACSNYSIPGVKHITEQITEISFNFDVQFVQPAPPPGISNVKYLNQEKLKITIFSFHD